MATKISQLVPVLPETNYAIQVDIQKVGEVDNLEMGIEWLDEFESNLRTDIANVTNDLTEEALQTHYLHAQSPVNAAYAYVYPVNQNLLAQNPVSVFQPYGDVWNTCHIEVVKPMFHEGSYPLNWHKQDTRLDERLTVPVMVSASAGSIEIMVNINSSSMRQVEDEYPTIFALRRTGSTDNGSIWLYHSPDDATWILIVRDDSGTIQASGSILDSTLSEGWHRISVTWDLSESEIKLYVDGLLESTESVLAMPTVEILDMGHRNESNVDFLNAPLADIRLSSIARTPEEILSDYAADTPLPVDEHTTIKISLDETTVGTAGKIKTLVSTDGESWTEVQSGQEIPGLEAESETEGKTLEIKQILHAPDASASPKVTKLVASVQSDNENVQQVIPVTNKTIFTTTNSDRWQLEKKEYATRWHATGDRDDETAALSITPPSLPFVLLGKLKMDRESVLRDGVCFGYRANEDNYAGVYVDNSNGLFGKIVRQGNGESGNIDLLGTQRTGSDVVLSIAILETANGVVLYWKSDSDPVVTFTGESVLGAMPNSILLAITPDTIEPAPIDGLLYHVVLLQDGTEPDILAYLDCDHHQVKDWIAQRYDRVHTYLPFDRSLEQYVRV